MVAYGDACGQENTCLPGNHTCWEGYDEQPTIYILSVPMTIALAVISFTYHHPDG